MTKKLTRSDVEELAAYASQKTYAGYCPPILPIPPGTLAELARVWLTVDSAPVISAQTAERAMFESNQMPMPGYGDSIKLVLVPEADSGGDRG